MRYTKQEGGSMRIATRSRYGLRFMIDLAQHWGKGPQPMREIAQLPANFKEIP